MQKRKEEKEEEPFIVFEINKEIKKYCHLC